MGGAGADSAECAADAWRLRTEDRPGLGPADGLGATVHGASVSRGAALARDPADPDKAFAEIRRFTAQLGCF